MAECTQQRHRGTQGQHQRNGHAMRQRTPTGQPASSIPTQERGSNADCDAAEHQTERCILVWWLSNDPEERKRRESEEQVSANDSTD